MTQLKKESRQVVKPVVKATEEEFWENPKQSPGKKEVHIRQGGKQGRAPRLGARKPARSDTPRVGKSSAPRRSRVRAPGLDRGRGAGGAGRVVRSRGRLAPGGPRLGGAVASGRGAEGRGLRAARRGRGRPRGVGGRRAGRALAGRPGGGGEGPSGCISARAGPRVPSQRPPPASMQCRRPLPPAPRPGGPRPAAPLLLLLPLLLLPRATAVPAGRGDPAAAPRWFLPQAARAALHFFNFRAGSPSTLQELAAVLEGRAWINQKEGCKVDLVFTTEPHNPEVPEERAGKCSAQVFFKNQKPRPAINVTCTRLVEESRRREEDYLLYQHMKHLTVPLDFINIPDSHGHIEPSLTPVWDLAFLGGSYVMWEKTTQSLHYYMVQLTRVQQWKTDEDAIDFDYSVVLHEFPTQEVVPCRIHLVWYPGKPPKVQYRCQEPQAPEEASGTEEGSAAALAPLGSSNVNVTAENRPASPQP
ncbi:retinoic acid receptor responder protein 1 [Tenrec ecaudatus]|uniref:retinoic acid receptor responder protein 1 n=1 Tax=Tenrec ecaudatus TaxID=94439 RepID=UPI003F5ADACB